MGGHARASTMEGGNSDQQQHHGGYVPPVHQPPPAVYGYPIDPSWTGNAVIHQPQPPPHPMGYPHPGVHPHMEGVPLPPGIPGLGASTDPLEAVLGPFPCARLANLPFDATLEDILVLFQGLVVIDVVLVGSGEAFVVFANPMDYQMALQRDRQPIGRTFVEIYQGSRNEYYGAIATQQWEEQKGDPLLPEEEDEPLSVGDHDDRGLDEPIWGSLGLDPPPIQTLNTQPPVKGGDSQQQQQQQQQQRRGGGPSVYPPAGTSGGGGGGGGGSASGGGGRGRGGGGGRGSGASAGPGNQQSTKRSGGGIQVGEHTGFLRMRGLPFSATKDDIAFFFQAYTPIYDSIVLTYRSDGRATGEAYVGFGSPDDSQRAMELHRKSMGQRYIELFLSNEEEHGRALARFAGR